MKKLLLLIIIATAFGCKKNSDETLPIDMTLRSYSTEAKVGSLFVILSLDFKSDGTVRLKEFPSNNFVDLKYEVADKMAENTSLKVFGEVDKMFYAEGIEKGKKIDWYTTIGRLKYNAHIVGFTLGDYHFTSK